MGRTSLSFCPVMFIYWVLLFSFSWCRTSAQLEDTPVDIHVTIKEEQLPGTQLANLMNEPEFLKTIQQNAASNDASSSSNSQSAGTTPNLQFKVLTSGNPNSHFFSVNETSGVVTITKQIDREKVCSFRDDCELRFELAATSAYNNFFVLIDFLITVVDINDNPPEFTQPEFDLFIPENAESGRSFPLPTAFDRDTGPDNGVKSYSLLSGPPLFQLETVRTQQNTSDLYVTLVNTVNRESAAFYKLVVGATDGGVPPLTGMLAVNVQVSDINDNFPVFEEPLYVVKVPEDKRTDQSIVQVKASDADDGDNGELVYSFSTLQPPDNLAFFRIDPESGEIFLSKSIESKTGQDLELVVEAKDKGHPPKVSTCTVKIHVEDTVNSMPQIIIDPLAGGKEIAEVSEYAKVGKVMLHVSVRDPDSGDNGRTSCRLDSPEFKLFKLTDDGKFKVALMASLNREITDFYNVTIFCSDHGFFSLMATAKFYVRVLDENDHKPVFSQITYETSIKENNTIGASVIQLTVTDADIGKNAEFDFSVLGINENYFAIDESGKMTAKVPLNREDSDRIVVKVMATDRGNPPLSSSATVVVDLIDVNDMRPEFSQKVYQFRVQEAQPVGRYIGIVSASDRDVGENQRVSYRLSSAGNDFVVGPDGGVIKTNVVLDREEQRIYELFVVAVDHGTPPLTGMARVIIQVMDVNDNIPYFKFPFPGNDSITIPHTFDIDTTIITVEAFDNDIGLNAQLTYSISSINASSPFAIHPDNGNVYLQESMSASDVGTYTLTLIASDSSPESQLATQTPFYIDVYFDNSTLLASAGTAGPSKAIITILIVIGVCVLIGVIIFVTFVLIRRSEAKKRGGFPISASTSSTTKLQGGYYIAPGVGVRSSSSTYLHKPDEGTLNGHVDNSDGIQVGNPYVVMMSPNARDINMVAQPEIVEISRASRNPRLDDTLNTVDLDQTDDGQFSTFKSQENIIAPGPRHDSLRRQSTGTSVYKSGNDTFDELSCDSTSDSGRGGSDVDVNNGAAASKEKARAKASTPVSVQSGISDRLSPLPRDPNQRGAFLTFRGESPSSFKFDSDSDTTLTRQSLRPRFSPMPMIASPGQPHNEPRSSYRNSYLSNRLSESDTDNDMTPRSRLNSQPSAIASLYPGGGGYGSGGEGPSRHPFRVAPLPMFVPPSSLHRYDSEPEHSDGGGSNPTSSLSRRNHVPRLPIYSGIDFSHHAYGGSNRNSIGAFSNISAASNSDGHNTDNERVSSHSANNYPKNNNNNNNSNNNNNNHRPSFLPPSHITGLTEESPFSSRYNNVVSELQTSRPVSMEEDFLLPPYPEVDEEGERTPVPSRCSGMNGENRDGEREALVSQSSYSTA